jgi:phosphoadenosine phosphosulfate reductase
MSLVNDFKVSVPDLYTAIQGKSIEQALAFLAEKFEGAIAFSTSLGIEDQALTHIIYSNNLPIRVFTLDTGRLFPETYSLLQRTNNRYNTKIEVFFPKHTEVEDLLNKKGPFSFYDSIEARKECCFVRKVEPLNRALKGVKCWITGIRREQSDARQNLQLLEWDEKQQLVKFNPLLEWSLEEVKAFVKKENIPYNPLHDKGFVSIGCAPCTRAIREGEDFRAGRWWWEDNSKKECGLHAR